MFTPITPTTYTVATVFTIATKSFSLYFSLPQLANLSLLGIETIATSGQNPKPCLAIYIPRTEIAIHCRAHILLLLSCMRGRGQKLSMEYIDLGLVCCVYAHVYEVICAYLRMCICVCMHMCMKLYVHIYVCAYVCVCTCV